MGDDLSYGLNTLGPLCLWQCLVVTINLSSWLDLGLGPGCQRDAFLAMAFMNRIVVTVSGGWVGPLGIVKQDFCRSSLDA